MKRHVPGYLYAEPSIIGGMASILDLSGTLKEFNYSRNDIDADIKATASDWYAVGDDLRDVVEKYEQ